jgi:hypothetical protein
MEDKLAQAHKQLSQWHSPADFIALVEEWSPDSVVQPRNSFLREAWVLAEFVKLTQANRVRLSDPDENWPDGYFDIDGTTKAVEITEAMELNRRRGDELKVEDPPPRLDTVDDWVARAEQIPISLRASVERKAKKRYGSSATLLVYLNIHEWDIRQHEIEKVIVGVKVEHAAEFEQIIVLWKYKLY